MSVTFSFPHAYEIERIERNLAPILTANSPVFDIMPIESAPTGADMLLWDQEDDFTGMQQWRGLNNEPATVNRMGSKRYAAFPGVYGEKEVLREDELTRRKSIHSLSGASGPISLDDLVMQAHTQLLHRRLVRIETILWNLLISGSFSVSGPNGATVYQGSYTRQQITPATPWSTYATSTPLADMMAYRDLENGQDVTFSAAGGAYQLMNAVTARHIFKNANAADLGGKKVEGGNTLNGINATNNIFLEYDIPPIRVYNKGYKDASATFQKWIPDGKVLLVGKRLSGVRVGAYRYTINQVSLNAATKPVVFTKIRTDLTPEVVEVHDHHNGGPILQYPGALAVVNAA